MNKRRTMPLLAMSASAILSTIGVGYGNWIIATFKERDGTIETTASIPVCYIQGKKEVKYTSIEKALAVTSDKDHINTSETIVVIPGTNPTISNSCTLSANDTLLIPYEDETYMRDLSKITKNNVSTVFGKEYSDCESTSVTNNRKTEIVIKGKDAFGDKVVLNNNGKIIVGGELGVGDGNQRPSGHTNGKYSQITIEDGAVIENNGSMDVYGFIKKEKKGDTGKIKSNASSSISMPLVINDFKGGSYSAPA